MKSLLACLAALAVLAPVGSALAAATCNVSVRTSNSHSCNGTLIGPNKVVTSAHCVGGALSSYSILAGSTDRTVTNCATCQLRTLTSSVRHPSYNTGTYDNDVAVLTVGTPFTANANIQFCTMRSTVVPVGSSCNVTGFGPTGLQTIAQTAVTPTGAGHLSLKDPANLVAVSPAFGGAGVYCNGNTTMIAGILSRGSTNPTVPSISMATSTYLTWISAN